MDGDKVFALAMLSTVVGSGLVYGIETAGMVLLGCGIAYIVVVVLAIIWAFLQ